MLICQCLCGFYFVAKCVITNAPRGIGYILKKFFVKQIVYVTFL